MSDQNLYPPDNPKARKKPQRAPRPRHLPPYDPKAARAEPTAAAAPDAQAKKLVQAGPAATPTFGAKAGANNALLFHQLKAKAPAKSSSSSDDGSDDNSDDTGG